MFKKERIPFICLLEIPVWFFVYVILIGVGAQLDQLLFSGQVQQAQEGEVIGHGFPFFTVIVFVIATILLIVAVVKSIVDFIRYSIKKHKKKKAAQEYDNNLPMHDSKE